MAFPERLLGEHEDLIYDLRPHWWTLVGPVLVTFLALVVGLLLSLLVPSGVTQIPLQIGITVVAFGILAVWVLPRYLRWLTTHFVLTSDRVIFRSGIFAKYAREIPLERLNDVTFTQSFWERVIGAGDLLIESAGEQGQSRFYDIRHPEEVQLEIARQMELNSERLRTVHVPRGTSPVDELERLADLLDRGVLSNEEFERKKRDLLDRI